MELKSRVLIFGDWLITIKEEEESNKIIFKHNVSDMEFEFRDRSLMGTVYLKLLNRNGTLGFRKQLELCYNE